MKKSLKGFNCRFNHVEKRISKFEYRSIETIYSMRSRNENKINNNEQSLRDLWYTIKNIRICIMGVPERQKRKKPERTFEEIMTETSQI